MSQNALLLFSIGLGIFCCLGMILKSYQWLRILIKTKGYSPRKLLKDFRQKMWMTTGLGSIFFGIYLSIILVGSWLIDKQTGQYLFDLIYTKPTYFIYLGLFFFAFNSLLIYLIRMIIKYLYLTTNKK